MFNKKNKEELADQLAVYQKRAAPRWGEPKIDLDAGISLTGYEGEGHLGNVSITGCCMKSVTYVNIIPGNIYQARIIPGKDDKMKPFNLKLKLSWTKSSEDVFLAGFALEDDSNKYELKQYIQILCARGIEPDYGNMLT